MAWGVRWRGGGGTSWCHKWAVAQVGGTERCWCTTSGVQSKIEEAPPGGGTSLVGLVGGGGQVLVDKFWGAKQLYGCTTRWWHKWWRKLVVAQVVAQVWRKLVWWRKFRFLI